MKSHTLSYNNSKVGNDQMHIHGEMNSGKWTLSGFVRSRPESLWWFEVDLWHLRVHFRRGTPPFIKSTCPQVWAQKDWEWLDVYSRRMGPQKVALNLVRMVPYVVLRLISYVFLTSSTHTFQEPIPFSKAHALSITHSKVGNDQMRIRGEMTSRKWTLSGFVKSRPESLWWFEVDFWHLRVHFRRGPPPFSESTCP